MADMTGADYASIARIAGSWAGDPALPAAKRRMAKALAELAGILTDPYYGCPSEVEALRLIGCRLCQGLNADVCRQSGNRVGNCECPLGLHTAAPEPG